MPSTAEEARLDLAVLTGVAMAEIYALLAELREAPAASVRDVLLDVLAELGDAYGEGAAVLAADWYDELREFAGVPGRFRASPAPSVDRARWEALARWGVDPLYAENPDHALAVNRVAGGLQRTVADRHRLTIVDNSIHDPQASGWSRVSVGETCGFCRMLVDRGAVYTEAGVTFRSHDLCDCAASPSWDSDIVKVSAEPYRQSLRNRSKATKKIDNARAYEYIAENYGET